MNNVNYDNDWREKVIDFMEVFQLSFLDNAGEKNMIGIYFSGTGNTKYCLEKFVALYDRNIEITPLEDEGTIEKVAYHKDIIFAYPIYYSNLPKIVRDFICENSDVWKGKRILLLPQWVCLAAMVQEYLQDCLSDTARTYGVDFI